jgi:hypothetical protein
VLREAHWVSFQDVLDLVRLAERYNVKPIKTSALKLFDSNTKLLKIAKAAERCTGTPTCLLSNRCQYGGEHQISDISRFWVNDVTLMKILKFANSKFHDLFQLRRGIHGKSAVLPINERSTRRDKE